MWNRSQVKPRFHQARGGLRPNSQKVLAEIFEGVPNELRHRILVDNPVEFFHLDATRPLTPTPGREALEREQEIYGRKPHNGAAVEAILAATRLPIQLGGGIRDIGAIEGWLARGIARVVLGTAAVRDPDLVRRAAGA